MAAELWWRWEKAHASAEAAGDREDGIGTGAERNRTDGSSSGPSKSKREDNKN